MFPLLWLSLSFLGGVIIENEWGGPAGVWGAGLAGCLLLAAGRAAWRGRVGRRLAARLPRVALRLPRAPAVWRRALRPFNRLAQRLAGRLPRPGLPVVVLAAAVCLGGLRLALQLPRLDPGHAAWYASTDTRYIIEGVLVGDPDRRDRVVQQRLRVERLHAAGELRFIPAGGDLLARLPPGDWPYGTRVRLSGWIEIPSVSEDFSYRDYLARQGVYAVFRCAMMDERCALSMGRRPENRLLQAIYRLRQAAAAAVDRLIPDPEGALLQGILLGIESGIPEGVRQAFNASGASHIIAISGYNFALVASLLSWFFSKLLGRWRGMLAAFAGIVFYALLAGAGAGVVRAAVMGVLGVLAVQLGRRQHGLNSLAFAAALMALHDPYVLWDVSFQLSFAATLGLVQYATPLSEWFTALLERGLGPGPAYRLAGPASEYLLMTLAAQLTTLPLVLFYFQRLSIVSLVANPLVLPAQPPVMLLGGLAAGLGLVSDGLAQPAAYAVWPFLAYTIRVVELAARAPTASLAVAPFGVGLLLGYYALLAGWTAWGGRLRAWLAARWGGDPLGSGLERLGWLCVVLLGAAAVVAWQNLLALPDGRLHLALLDVSQAGGSGTAVLLQTPSGARLLVGGGPSLSALSDGLGRRLPLGRRRLDWLVVAAAGESDLAALPDLLERYPPGQALWAGPTTGSYSARRLHQALNQRRTRLVLAQTGQALDLGQGALLRVLAAGSRGAVLLVEWRSFRALLPLGLDFDQMDALLQDRSLPPVTALLLAESGYAPLNTPEWLQRWDPQLALLSVSPGDYSGLPDPAVLQALDGRTLLRTDHNGWIELSTDGDKLWIAVERISRPLP